MTSLGPMNENKWLGFEEKLMGNYTTIAGDPNPTILRVEKKLLITINRLPFYIII
jgi:hypothetical protein